MKKVLFTFVVSILLSSCYLNKVEPNDHFFTKVDSLYTINSYQIMVTTLDTSFFLSDAKVVDGKLRGTFTPIGNKTKNKLTKTVYTNDIILTSNKPFNEIVIHKPQQIDSTHLDVLFLPDSVINSINVLSRQKGADKEITYKREDNTMKPSELEYAYGFGNSRVKLISSDSVFTIHPYAYDKNGIYLLVNKDNSEIHQRMTIHCNTYSNKILKTVPDEKDQKKYIDISLQSVEYITLGSGARSDYVKGKIYDDFWGKYKPSAR